MVSQASSNSLQGATALWAPNSHAGDDAASVPASSNNSIGSKQRPDRAQHGPRLNSTQGAAACRCSTQGLTQPLVLIQQALLVDLLHCP